MVSYIAHIYFGFFDSPKNTFPHTLVCKYPCWSLGEDSYHYGLDRRYSKGFIRTVYILTAFRYHLYGSFGDQGTYYYAALLV